MPSNNFGRCCTDCQTYWTCETKWYRGERHLEDICCATCNYYTNCSGTASKSKKKKK